MPDTDLTQTGPAELDVRELRKPDKHPAIFARFDALAAGESFVLLNNHYPRHLRDEFDVEHPGGYGWEVVENGPRVWRVRIGKLASTSPPRILTDTTMFEPGHPDTTGAVWTLPVRRRDLDANIIRIAPHGRIEAHNGPDLDVLIHVLDGAGTLSTELGELELAAGALVWLPRRSRRAFTAGAHGLRYLTVHQRRQALVLDPVG
ncbi:DUF2249 domain-containing protein [Nocardia cyriacigeorgica]|uniref:DUF2249 domain-containing protein n=1 Tax=Nocardia cyriacigeorgica TaxID=135487 RepID=A0A6P1CS39_9NOCA|nr:DUF2249 domain-containing protein [Nocardia cyriacigeorgica]MBF6080252.1 DUF2249 domain-containing protein [Nocardia cyriacigeorgica]MBF6423085.1 DUF2249 domain-containing protein [Nocardia cyriacigeorgica]NEW32935.1 DUF2249 domain-containing protein [Nocardia cyriacigeorgica]